MHSNMSLDRALHQGSGLGFLGAIAGGPLIGTVIGYWVFMWALPGNGLYEDHIRGMYGNGIRGFYLRYRSYLRLLQCFSRQDPAQSRWRATRLWV